MAEVMIQDQLANVDVASAATPTAVYTLGTTGSVNATEVAINSILVVNRSTTTTIEVTGWSVPNGETRGDEHIIVPSILIPPRGVEQAVPTKVLAHTDAGAAIWFESDTASSLTVVITGAEFE